MKGGLAKRKRYDELAKRNRDDGLATRERYASKGGLAKCQRDDNEGGLDKRDGGGRLVKRKRYDGEGELVNSERGDGEGGLVKCKRGGLVKRKRDEKERQMRLLMEGKGDNRRAMESAQGQMGVHGILRDEMTSAGPSAAGRERHRPKATNAPRETSISTAIVSSVATSARRRPTFSPRPRSRNCVCGLARQWLSAVEDKAKTSTIATLSRSRRTICVQKTGQRSLPPVSERDDARAV
ncbi:hypothetical protein BC936DRAFT_145946 [Jimgerdemannia flammicorona]|uniref:Uncharacterized protein n=1 Tax=Jimgerdemannia flammicorona TaxID=994334 RepID=A0A433D8P0_9FUNG|nr:hypothetical protein BC936DRAFT_145946 [Jimgerdemannia flammicorona]